MGLGFGRDVLGARLHLLNHGGDVLRCRLAYDAYELLTRLERERDPHRGRVRQRHLRDGGLGLGVRVKLGGEGWG